MEKHNGFAGLVLCLLTAGWLSSAQGQFDHKLWDELLSQHVREFAGGSVTTVDYSGFLREEQRLQVYLDSLAQVGEDKFRRWRERNSWRFLSMPTTPGP